jgi:hypothetical protein
MEENRENTMINDFITDRVKLKQPKFTASEN